VHENWGTDPGGSSPGLLNPRLLSRTPPAFGVKGIASVRETGNASVEFHVAAAGDGRAPGRGVAAMVFGRRRAIVCRQSAAAGAPQTAAVRVGGAAWCLSIAVLAGFLFPVGKRSSENARTSVVFPGEFVGILPPMQKSETLGWRRRVAAGSLIKPLVLLKRYMSLTTR